MKPINALTEEKAELLNVETGGTYSHHCVLNE
jgi:hypothetical protein